MQSSFTSSAVELMSESEAEIVLANARYTGSEASSAEHKVLIDSVQMITLGGISLGRVIGTGVQLAKTNGYSKGVYDYFDNDQVKYGNHVASIANNIDASTSVTSMFVYTGDYSISRTQLRIVSELITPQFGDSYYVVELIEDQVSTGASKTRDYKRVIGLAVDVELYVKDAAEGKFYFLRDGKEVAVYLASASVYDFALNKIQEGNNLNLFKQQLSKLSKADARDFAMEASASFTGRSSARQKLFLTVFKAIKASITPIA